MFKFLYFLFIEITIKIEATGIKVTICTAQS